MIRSIGSNVKNRAHFENLKMDEKEYIVTYLLRVDEVVNSIRGLGEYLSYKRS